MNTKYNNAFVADYYHKSDKSYFEKYLQEEIDFLLTASANELHEVKFDDIYVSKPDEEDTLRKLLKPSFSDKIIYLTGVTGVGKTMLLRKVFQIHNMTPIIIDDTNTMVIPISFDNAIISPPCMFFPQYCITILLNYKAKKQKTLIFL